MGFSYSGGLNPTIDYVRLLVSDTDASEFIFSDSEILSAYQIQNSTFQSSMFFSGTAGQTLPTQPVSYLRVAALLLDSLAANKSRLASIKRLPDVQLDAADAAIQLRATAAEYRNVDDNSGAIYIIEQCSTTWNFRDRYWAQVQRETAGGPTP